MIGTMKEKTEIKVTPADPESDEGGSEEEEMVDEDQLTKLEYSFTFWFSYFRENKLKQVDDYENFIKNIGEFKTAEEFWGFYQHIRRPDSLPKSCEFYLFKTGIRPLWEDPANRGGGRFVLHIKKIFANKTWEDMLIAFIISTKNESEINGVVINVRSWEVLLSVWMKKLETPEICDKYRLWIRKSLGMTENIMIEYKEHPNPEDVKHKTYPAKEEEVKTVTTKPVEEENEEEESSKSNSKPANSESNKQPSSKDQNSNGYNNKSSAGNGNLKAPNKKDYNSSKTKSSGNGSRR